MFQHLFNLIYPKNCVGCKSVLLNLNHFICSECLHNLDFIPEGKTSNPSIFNRLYGKVRIQNANAVLYYDKKEISHLLIHELKYRNKQEIGVFFAELAFMLYKNHAFFSEINELFPVPLHKKKEKDRGYNQLDSFGKRLSELSGIPYNKSRLSKNFKTSSQTNKNIFLRSELKKNLFSVNFSNEDEGKHFLLLDDVITTGSTIEIVGKELLKIPNSKLSVFFMAATK